jgi:hypothetical protein
MRAARPLLPALLPCALLTFAACTLPSDPDPVGFMVRVDSFHAPAALALTDTLRLKLFASIGPDDCHDLDRIDVARTASTVAVAVYGLHTNAGFCLARPSRLHGWEHKVPPPFPEDFTVEVHQPDGSRLSRTVRVAE